MKFSAKLLVAILAILVIPLWAIYGAYQSMFLLYRAAADILDDIDRTELF